MQANDTEKVEAAVREIKRNIAEGEARLRQSSDWARKNYSSRDFLNAREANFVVRLRNDCENGDEAAISLRDALLSEAITRFIQNPGFLSGSIS